MPVLSFCYGYAPRAASYRRIVIELVLGTDMAFHQSLLATFVTSTSILGSDLSRSVSGHAMLFYRGWAHDQGLFHARVTCLPARFGHSLLRLSHLHTCIRALVHGSPTYVPRLATPAFLCAWACMRPVPLHTCVPSLPMYHGKNEKRVRCSRLTFIAASRCKP